MDFSCTIFDKLWPLGSGDTHYISVGRDVPIKGELFSACLQRR